MSTPPQKTPEEAPDDAWAPLRPLTAARIGLARSGASLATGPLLDFRLAHARARDAVHAPLDEAKLVAELTALRAPVVCVSSAATSPQDYLMRPDLGRKLSPDARVALAACAGRTSDVAFIVADGLSARAVQDHARPVLAALLPELGDDWTVATLVVARRARVALGDAIAVALNATIAVVLIGERPGLTAPDSMGAYLTWQPGPHTTDAERNCLSNIRPEGLTYADAAFKLRHLLNALRAHRKSGVALKDDADRLLIER
jgi:ethanolamine ammonia-lyase small subunit